MTQVTKIINGVDNKHHDYDYTQHLIHLSMNVGGVGYASKTALTEFDLDTVNSVIKPWIAFVACVRNSSQPIPNMKFMSVFYSDADVSVVVWPNRKYYIEIDQNKINDPSLIDDPSGSNDYYLWKWIWAIKSWTSRPVHPNYLKLWSTNWSWARVDERVRFMVNGRNVDLSDIENTNLDLNWYAGVITASTITATNIYATLLSVTWTANLPSWATFGGLTLTQILQINMATEIMRWLTKYLSFGDGSDWDVTLGAGTTTLSRDMYYNNLTIPSWATLNPNWYRVFVRYTLSGTGIISRNWNNWWAWWYANNVWIWWTALNQWTLNADIWGVNWWEWWFYSNSWAYTAWQAGISVNPSMMQWTWSTWWRGGNTIGTRWGAGWVWGTATRWSMYNKLYDYKFMHIATANGVQTLAYKWSPSGGGGGGWSFWWSNTMAWWAGGGSGGSWGMIWIACHNWNFTWTVSALWGNWWAGGNAIVAWAWGGGWAGGTGWVLLRILSVITNEATINLAWWTGWIWGTAIAGSYTNGEAWNNWLAWSNITIMTTP